MLFYILGHLEYFIAIGCILWSSGNFIVVWYIFYPIWYIATRKIWQPWFQAGKKFRMKEKHSRLQAA
jgi:hypothetical protein